MIDQIACPVVLVAPTARRPHQGFNTLMDRFDKPKILSNRLLLKVLKSSFQHVYHYKTEEDFVDNLSKHLDHLVLPYCYGVGSRMNSAFLPSICEKYSIRFVGPEAYALTVCNDKVLSKDICRHAAIHTPRCVVMYHKDDDVVADFLQPPLIVKPVFEGNSIGINKESLCSSLDEAKGKARALCLKISAPVMLEEFVAGQEISLCVLGDHATHPLVNTVVLNKNSEIYDYSQKHSQIKFKRYKPYSAPLILDHIERFLSIFKMLGKVEFMRFDCIVRDNQLSCFELTPDADLAIGSALYQSLSSHMTYAEFIRTIVSNTYRYYKNR